MSDPPLPPSDDDLPPEPDWSARGDEPDAEVGAVDPTTGELPLTDPTAGFEDVVGDEATTVVESGAPGEPTAVMPASPTDGLSITQQIRRHRVSRRRYWIRRVAVIAMAAVVIIAAVFLLTNLRGDGGDDDAVGPADTAEDNAVVGSIAGGPATEPERPAPVATTKPRPSTTSSTIGADDATTSTSTSSTTLKPSTTMEAPARVTTSGTSRQQGSTSTTSTTTDDDDSPPGLGDPVGSDPVGTDVGVTSLPGEGIYELDSPATCELTGGAAIGMSGPDVLCIEQRLSDVTIGSVDFKIDQIFDAKTEAAVKAFQEAIGLVVDGKVGPETGKALGIWPG